jgi:cation:H+ antiporter
MVNWLQFVVCTTLIVFSGSRLSQYGDVIAEKTGMGQTWIGVILMASVTSLPELITGISSVTVYNLPNIAAGDVLGSCMFNLVILAALDIGRRQAPISSLAHQGQILTAAFGIVLLGLTSIGILAADSIPALGWISIASFFLLGLYLAGMRIIFRYERRRISEFLSAVVEEGRYDHIPKSAAYRRFVLYAAIIVAAATYLPHIADEIATSSGLGRTFVGSIFVALATSLPEVVVSRAALRMGAVDLAVGNILGSNLFNIAILAIDDAAYLHGPILSHVSGSHTLTAVAAMTMTAVMMLALVYRSKKKILAISWESLGVFFIYAVTGLLLFLKR